MAQKLAINQMSLTTLLKENDNMVIPLYQRGYAWESQQVEELWDDLIEVNDDQQTDHFFGQVVMNDSEGKLFIIDGQQRVTTSVIFISLLRNKLIELSENFSDVEAKIRANDIQKNLIGSRGDYHLKQSEDLNQYFIDNIQTPNSFSLEDKPKKGSEKNVYNAYVTLNRKLEEYLKQYDNPNDRRSHLHMLFQKFSDDFFVITLTTSDEAAAFVIFETLNARGRDLNASDLLKNHILRTAKSELEQVKVLWDLMIDSLGNDSSKATHYIRAYWNATHQFVNEKNLYKSIYKEIRTSQEALVLAQNLNKLSYVYEAISNPKNVDYFEDHGLKESLITLLNLGGKTFYPLILALVENNFTESEILTSLHKIYSFIIRNFTIGNMVANKYEKLFSKIAIMINRNELVGIDNINHEITKQMLNDQKFTDDFTYAEVKTGKASKHILKDIFYASEAESIDLNNVHVVHLNKSVENPDLLSNKLLITKKEFTKLKSGINLQSVLQDSKFSYTRQMSNQRDISEESLIDILKDKAPEAVAYWR